MASEQIPASLPKSISVFINRSRELENSDAIISYFCKLYAVEQILESGLHQSDEEVSVFAVELLDNIENIKGTADEKFLEIINDKELSAIYVLNFSNDIFNNSLKQIQEHKSNKGTALGFLASVNFYELVKLWEKEKLDDSIQQIVDNEEISKKTKYAKYHAARILKSLKKGDNPNDYDPPVFDITPVDKAVDSIAPEARSRSATPETTSAVDLGLPGIPKTDTSDAEVPSVPVFIDEAVDDNTFPSLPTVPIEKPKITSDVQKPEAQVPDVQKPEAQATEAQAPDTTKRSQPQELETIDVDKIVESSETYSKAQKHAKFAISAMNYEDKTTAIKELNQALELLLTLQ